MSAPDRQVAATPILCPHQRPYDECAECEALGYVVEEDAPADVGNGGW